MSRTTPPHPAEIVAHLQPEIWNKVNRLLVRKAISEYAHEWLLEPQRLGSGETPGFERFRLTLADGAQYDFDAQVMAMRHWRIPPESIVKTVAGVPAPLDALQFVIEIRDKLGLPVDRLPIYMDEITSTLHGSAYKHGRTTLGAAALARADYQTIETSMIEGHPSFVANNGRLGFDAEDYHGYAPEAATPVRLMWLAVHKDNAHFSCLSDMDYDSLMSEELGESAVTDFAARLREQGLHPADYYFMPAHPWQWFNKLSLAFAPTSPSAKSSAWGTARSNTSLSSPSAPFSTSADPASAM